MEAGKGLSTEDFTTALKTKLEGLETGLTQAEVEALIAEVVDAAPAALDTLKELATSLGNDSDFAGTMEVIKENDGVCVFVPPDEEPDYIVKSVNNDYSPKLFTLERRVAYGGK